jgi:hypothetical protein
MDTALSSIPESTVAPVHAEPGGSPVAAASSPLQQLQHQMRDAGWEIDFIELDVRDGVHPRAQIKVSRLDGRWLWAYVNHGRAGMERWHRRVELGMPRSVKGRSPLSPQIDDQFLGRVRCAEPGELLQTLAHYVAANPGRLALANESKEKTAARVASLQAAWAALVRGHNQLTLPGDTPAIEG